jgi:hypothetical protein
MAYQGGPIVRSSGTRLAGTGAALAALILAGCSQVLPLGRSPAAVAPPRHLAAPIVMQAALIAPRELGTPCPAGYTTIPALGSNSAGPPNECYRPTGNPATFTSATVTVDWQPAQWVLRVSLLPPDATALKAIIATANESRDDLVAIVAGKAWTISGMQQLQNGQFEIVAGSSKGRALQSQRELLHSASTLKVTQAS